jgi:hypothetical protein
MNAHEPRDEILDLILSRVDGELADALARRRRPSLSDEQLDAILGTADADLLRVLRSRASLAFEDPANRCETQRHER